MVCERLLGEARGQLDQQRSASRVDAEQRHDLAVGVEEGGGRALARLEALDVVGEHALEER